MAVAMGHAFFDLADAKHKLRDFEFSPALGALQCCPLVSDQDRHDSWKLVRHTFG